MYNFYHLVRKGQHKEAIKNLEKLRMKQPAEEYRIAIAAACFDMNELEYASELLHDQIRRKPNLRAYDLLARIRLKRKEFKEAKEYLNSAAEFKPSNTEHLMNVATLYIGSHQASDVLNTLVEENIICDSQIPYAEKEEIIQHDTFNKLVKFFQSGIKDKDRASIFNAFALIANKKERYDSALRYYIIAYVFAGNDTELKEKLLHNIAIAQFRLQRTDKAISCYEYILKTNPKDEAAARKLGSLSAHHKQQRPTTATRKIA